MDDAVLTRRTVLRTAVLATTALASPFVRGAHAAGKLSFGVWDHWVPKESEVMLKPCNEWSLTCLRPYAREDGPDARPPNSRNGKETPAGVLPN